MPFSAAGLNTVGIIAPQTYQELNSPSKELYKIGLFPQEIKQMIVVWVPT